MHAEPVAIEQTEQGGAGDLAESPLGALLPGGCVRPGTAVSAGGDMPLLLALAAEVSADSAGWAAVGLPDLGPLAAADAGLDVGAGLWVDEPGRHRVLSRVVDELEGADRPRLYVLEIAGAVPRVKIGVSTHPRTRVQQHVTEMTRYQHGLVDAYVTAPRGDHLAADRAEGQAHRWMRKIFAPIGTEEFAYGDFDFGVVRADQAVRIQGEAGAW
ncbi:hypothetical protein [Streptomyces spongiae]|uniref:Uncharacterized protein n=1 Tax=Streptomyces spongiae TaxID=565072 RepID=A0A5N8XRB6_9ACTN|nr:hypothetical protein [Streptomyces spongiae]MPY61961.1 hypothetical protein [Streptomyces spongiae]